VDRVRGARWIEPSPEVVAAEADRAHLQGGAERASLEIAHGGQSTQQRPLDIREGC
jgi:hypothetical protein